LLSVGTLLCYLLGFVFSITILAAVIIGRARRPATPGS
jgi:hypothetical protein